MFKNMVVLYIACGIALAMPIVAAAMYVSEMMQKPLPKAEPVKDDEPREEVLYIVDGDSVEGLCAKIHQ